MTPLIKFIKSEYLKNTDTQILMDFLEQNNLLNFFDKIIETIETKRSDIKVLSANILKSCNDALKKEENVEKKKQVELDLTIFMFKLIALQYRHSPLSAKLFMRDIRLSLEETCILNNYNFKELSDIIDFDKLAQLLFKIPKHNVDKKNIITSCRWEKEQTLLEKLLELLHGEKYIVNPLALQSLLNEDKYDGLVIYEKKHLDTLIVLFNLLIEKNFIVLLNGKGKWQFFSNFFVDVNGKKRTEKTLANKLSQILTEATHTRNERTIKKAEYLLNKMNN